MRTGYEVRIILSNPPVKAKLQCAGNHCLRTCAHILVYFVTLLVVLQKLPVRRFLISMRSPEDTSGDKRTVVATTVR